jgi:hypothetical protein
MTKQPAYYRDLLEALGDEPNYARIAEYTINRGEYQQYWRAIDLRSHVSKDIIMYHQLKMCVYPSQCQYNIVIDTSTIKNINRDGVEMQLRNEDFAEEIKEILLSCGFSRKATSEVHFRHAGFVGQSTCKLFFNAPGVAQEITDAVGWAVEKAHDELDRKRMREL